MEERSGPRPAEVEALGDVAGLDLVHLQCHFGLDTLAWADAGARGHRRSTSPRRPSGAAEDLAKRLGWQTGPRSSAPMCSDAAAHPAPQTFDVVYVSLGALGWLPSVAGWADQVSALARTGGRLYLHDGHPLAWSLAYDSLDPDATPTSKSPSPTSTTPTRPIPTATWCSRTPGSTSGTTESEKWSAALIDTRDADRPADGARLDRLPAVPVAGGGGARKVVAPAGHSVCPSASPWSRLGRTDLRASSDQGSSGVRMVHPAPDTFRGS